MENSFFNPKIMTAFCRVCAEISAQAGVELEFECEARFSPKPAEEAANRASRGYKVLKRSLSEAVVFIDTNNNSNPTILTFYGEPCIMWSASSMEDLKHAHDYLSSSDDFRITQALSTADADGTSGFTFQYIGDPESPMRNGPLGQINFRKKKIFGNP